MKLPVLLAPISLGFFLLADGAATQMLRGAHQGHEHRRASGDSPEAVATGTVRSLRTLLVQIWLIRIDSALRANKVHRALILAREALAMAPDLPEVRIQLAQILAYDLPPREIGADRQLAWIAEALAVLDEGIKWDAMEPMLHTVRGMMIRDRGQRFPVFESAFGEAYGRSTLEAGVDSLVEGARVSRGDWWPVRAAGIGLERRGDERLAAASRGNRELFALAKDDYAAEEMYLRELLRFSGFARPALNNDLAYAQVSQELVDLEAARSRGGRVDPEGIASLHKKRQDLLEERWQSGQE